MSELKSLTHKQNRAIAALLESSSIEQAAFKAVVNPRTIYRWLDDQTFKTALSNAESKAIDRVSRRIVALSNKAVNGLESVLDNPSQLGAGNKRLAAVAILENLMRLRELATIEGRLAALEKLLDEKFN